MIAIINANLVRENGILWDASLLIDQGRIVDLGKSISIPEDAEIIDAAGAYVGPGFVDIHVHWRLQNFSWVMVRRLFC